MRFSSLLFFFCSLFASSTAQVISRSEWVELFEGLPEMTSGQVDALDDWYEGTIYWRSGLPFLNLFFLGLDDLLWRGVRFEAEQSEVTFYPLGWIFLERIFTLNTGTKTFETDSSLEDGKAIMKIDTGREIYECRYIDVDALLCLVGAGLGETSISSVRLPAKDRHFHLINRDPTFGQTD